MNYKSPDPDMIPDSHSDLPIMQNPTHLESLDFRNDPSVLIGTNRWMRRGAGGIIVGQPGIGVSSFAMQLASSLALGIPFFGAPIPKDNKVLYLQANLPLGDMQEQLQGIRSGMDLSEGQRGLLRRNLRIMIETSTSGMAFLDRVEVLIKTYKPDVIIADPLEAFFGGNLCNIGEVSMFLRNGGLSTILHRADVMWFWTHYTSDTFRKSPRRSPQDIYYAGYGSEEIAHWARTILVLSKTGKDYIDNGKRVPIFSVMIPKPESNSGFRDSRGQPVQSEFFIRHSADKIYWELAKSPGKSR